MPTFKVNNEGREFPTLSLNDINPNIFRLGLTLDVVNDLK